MTDQPRHIYGPIVVEKRNGSFEVWDNHWFYFRCLETFDTQAKADALAKKLNEMITRR